MFQLSIGIATMDRFDTFLSKFIPYYLSLPFLTKLVICDENGNDARKISEAPYASDPRLDVYVNKSRLGAYMNKKKVLSKCPVGWVCLIDSDNLPTQAYWDALFKEWETNGQNTSIIYAAPNGRFINDTTESTPLSHFAGFILTKENWNDFLHTYNWNMLANDGNYVLHSSAFHNLSDLSEEKSYAADVILMNKELIQKGFSLKVVPEMEYIHSVHQGSYWINTSHNSQRLWDSTDWCI